MRTGASHFRVAPASGGFNAASRRIASGRTRTHLIELPPVTCDHGRFRARRPKQPARRGCYP